MDDLDIAITDLGRAIDYFDQGDENSAYMRVEDALARLTKMRERTMERWIDRDELADSDDPYWYVCRTPKVATSLTDDDAPARVLIIPPPTP